MFLSGILFRPAYKLIVVAAHVARDAAQRSVGENELPSPPLSRGAVVLIRVEEGECSISQDVGL